MPPTPPPSCALPSASMRSPPPPCAPVRLCALPSASRGVRLCGRSSYCVTAVRSVGGNAPLRAAPRSGWGTSPHPSRGARVGAPGLPRGIVPRRAPAPSLLRRSPTPLRAPRLAPAVLRAPLRLRALPSASVPSPPRLCPPLRLPCHPLRVCALPSASRCACHPSEPPPTPRPPTALGGEKRSSLIRRLAHTPPRALNPHPRWGAPVCVWRIAPTRGSLRRRTPYAYRCAPAREGRAVEPCLSATPPRSHLWMVLRSAALLRRCHRGGYAPSIPPNPHPPPSPRPPSGVKSGWVIVCRLAHTPPRALNPHPTRRAPAGVARTTPQGGTLRRRSCYPRRRAPGREGRAVEPYLSATPPR